MDLLNTIFDEVVNVPKDKDPTTTPETEAAFNAAYDAFINPLLENPDTTKEGLDKEELLILTVATQSESSFRAGFYAAVELLLKRGGK